jgi:hypothetical protein
MNYNLHIQRKDLKNFFFKLLTEAVKNRGELSYTVTTYSGNNELAWIDSERNILYNAVNRERSIKGLQHITLNDFIKKENQAVGHSDYGSKLALYCAELVLGE